MFARWLYEVERQVAAALVERRTEQTHVQVEAVEAAVQRAEGELGITLDARQRDAVAMALKSNVMVVTGGPGTGKTTLTKAIVRAFGRVMLRTADGGGRRARVLVCAPTGKAAKRASEAIGCEAVTIHRALEWGPGGPKRDADNPVEADVLIVDEVSMVD
ncbi:helicase, RecD/TraA family, partial [mine drainage metagenome]